MYPRGGVRVKRRLLTIPVLLLALACAAGCASAGKVSLQGDFLKRERASVGVALGRAGMPGIRDQTGGYERLWPFVSGGPDYDREDIFSGRNDEGQQGPAAQGLQDGAVQPRQGALFTLRSQLDEANRDTLRNAVNSFAKGLERPGWRVAPLDLAIGKVNLDAPYLKGLDALVILDYTWYGARCHDAGLAGDLADGGADLTGRMIELPTGKVLWQSQKIRIRNPIWCRCSDPACYSAIARGVREAAYDATDAALKDFFGRTP